MELQSTLKYRRSARLQASLQYPRTSVVAQEPAAPAGTNPAAPRSVGTGHSRSLSQSDRRISADPPPQMQRRRDRTPLHTP